MPELLVLHLMIAGRLHWFAPGPRKTGRAALAYFAFDTGTLTLTEAGTKRRASLYVFGSSQQLAQHDPGGLEILDAPHEEFRRRLLAENHTLERSLTDPHAFSGIGNAVCGAPVQRIRYAENETNYCPGCQTGGRILADRSLSRLLKDDWPRTLDELG
jgi:formamidopyrimidine-DNA glycosylase